MDGKNVTWIDTNGTDPKGATVLDVEPGDATPAGAATWAAQRLNTHPHSTAVIYTMRSEWAAAQTSIAGLPHWQQHHVRWWIADPTGTPHIVPGSDATQWYWGTHYDISTVNPRSNPHPPRENPPRRNPTPARAPPAPPAGGAQPCPRSPGPLTPGAGMRGNGRDSASSREDSVTVYEQILYEVADPVATITLNRPDVLNAWTDRMGFEVRHALSQAEQDPRVVGIVITGACRGFCAGADMNRLTAVSAGGEITREQLPADLRADPGDPAFGDDLHLGTHTYLMSVPRPVIAAINGPAAGMAVPIVLACDLRFMAEDAIIMTAFAQRGLIAEWGLSWLLPRLVGPAAALDLLFSSRKVSGSEAASMGLVNAALPARTCSRTLSSMCATSPPRRRPPRWRS